MVSAPRLPVPSLVALARQAFGAGVGIRDARPQLASTAIGSFALSTIPGSYLALYRGAAATCPGLPWTVLAAIGAVETGHGADPSVSSKGAVGPMQFLPSSFAASAVDGNGDGIADINDPADAIYSAARYLCLAGASRGGQSLDDAIFSYNHARWYVRRVLRYAAAYAA
ncbi:MAG: lytic transglycosylase domain-containing protein [Frankiales bacterium]|nr:lytic transglycosylase domain-containing protein [Frankiales bacterium]